jgi:purine-nucleoside phosphorylase
MLDRIKNELLNVGLKFISVDEKLVRMFLETSPSNINEIVILPAIKTVMKKVVYKLEKKVKKGLVYNGFLNGVRVSVIRSYVGCPNTALILECLKRCKTKKVIRIDFCGGIQTNLNNMKIGDIIIPKLAYCGDGTTAQYVLKDPSLTSRLETVENPMLRYQNMITGNKNVIKVTPNEEITKLLYSEAKNTGYKNIKEVDLWTTDALFCETYDFINSLKEIEVEAIDMESSSLFLLGKIYNLKVASILSVSDLPTTEYDFLKTNELDSNYEKGIDKAIKILIQTIPKIEKI